VARVIHLGGLYGAVGSWMARAAAEAVLGTGNTPAYAVLRDPGLYGSTKLVQKGREAGAVLTGLGIEGRAGAEAPTAKTGGGVRRGGRGRGWRGGAPVLLTLGEGRRGPVERLRGVRGAPESPAARNLSGGACSPAGGWNAIRRWRCPESGAGYSRSFRSPKRRCCGPGPELGGTEVASPRRRRGSVWWSRGVRLLGFGSAAGVKVGCRRGRGSPL